MSHASEASPPPYSDAPLGGPNDSKLPSSDPGQGFIPGQDYIHVGENMEINLGPMYGLVVPAYGRRASVHGMVHLLDKAEHVKSIVAKLQVTLTIRTLTLGELTGPAPVRVVDLEQTLCAEDGYAFAFPLPERVSIYGVETPLPPSFSATTYDSTCTVLYMLKFELSRSGLRRHETIRLPFSYFPRSKAAQMDVDTIPMPADVTGEPFAGDASITSICLKPSRANLGAVYLSMPSAHTFASGVPIPFLLTLAFPESPSTAELLSADDNIRIRLRRHTRIGLSGGLAGKEVESLEKIVGRAQIKEVKSGKEGVLFFSGVIGAGERGREASWAAQALCDVQYRITVQVPAPDSVAKEVASWEGDLVVVLSTDGCGDIDDFTPALEMAKLIPRATSYQMSQYAL